MEWLRKTAILERRVPAVVVPLELPDVQDEAPPHEPNVLGVILVWSKLVVVLVGGRTVVATEMPYVVGVVVVEVEAASRKLVMVVLALVTLFWVAEVVVP